MLNTLKNFGKGLVFGSIILPIIALTALGHLTDLGTTWYAMVFTGAREANPFLAWFVNSNFRGKWVALAGLKALVIKNEVEVFYKYRPYCGIGFIKAMVVSCVFVWVVVGWNCSIILRRQYARTGSKA